MDIYRHLKEDHARQRMLANEIIETPPASQRRAKLFKKFKSALCRHADIEARTLYATLMRVPRAHPVAREGIEGQRKIAEALKDLQRYPIPSDQWTLHFVKLRELLEKLQCEEEELLYPAAQRLLTEPAIVERMTDQYFENRSKRHLPETPESRLCAGKNRPIPFVSSRLAAE